MADQKIPVVQLQGGKGPRRITALRKNSLVGQFRQKKARPDGTAYLPANSDAPAFSEHTNFCRLYIDDAMAVRAVLELAASKYGVPLTVNGDTALCRIILAAAAEMGLAVSTDEVGVPARPQSTPSPNIEAKNPDLTAASEPGLHPIANETLVRFTPSNKTRPVIEGKIHDSSTADNKSYRYRISLQPDGEKMVVVYSDDGVFEQVVEAEVRTEVDGDSVSVVESQTSTSVTFVDSSEPRSSRNITLSDTTPSWMMSKEVYLSDKSRVRLDVVMDRPGYKVEFEYVTPGIVGPFSGVLLSENKPTVGDTILAPFGDAVVKKVSASKEGVNDHGLILAGKLHHRRIVADALMAGQQVPHEVMVDYPEIQPKINDWVKQQIGTGIELAPILYDGIGSARGGVIHVSYNPNSDSYDVSHTINGIKHDHVTGVEADGAREAAQNLLGMASTKVVIAVPPVQAVQKSPMEAPTQSIDPLPPIDLLALFEEAISAGEDDYLDAVQASLDGFIQQANERIGANPEAQSDANANILNQQRIAAELSLREWTDNLGFLGVDPVEVAKKWRSVVTERDALIARVTELEIQAQDFADKNAAHQQEDAEKE